MLLKLKIYSKTDIGKNREENQDRVWVGNLHREVAAAVLCDGMGGENAGSYASELAINFISERLIKGFREDMTVNSLRNLMITGINGANSVVLRKAEDDPSLKGMGTTCVSAVAIGKRCFIVNVGDSRAYHIFGDNIQQITKDHTYIRKLIDDGRITEEESVKHPERNCITRAVGVEEFITPDYFEIELYDDSIILICSDGLHTYGSDAELAEIVVNNPINKACDLLINFALDKGGKDNISVCIIAV